MFVIFHYLLRKAKLDLSALGEGFDSWYINVSFSTGSTASCGVMKTPSCIIREYLHVGNNDNMDTCPVLNRTHRSKDRTPHGPDTTYTSTLDPPTPLIVDTYLPFPSMRAPHVPPNLALILAGTMAKTGERCAYP